MVSNLVSTKSLYASTQFSNFSFLCSTYVFLRTGLNQELSKHSFAGGRSNFSALNMSMSACEEFVKGNVHPNGVAIITLDRPKALNAMNAEMDKIYKRYLDEWEADPKVKCVVIEGSTPRAFCAGGDVKGITTNKDLESMIEVFTAEYSLICKIGHYKKPYISLMDGITMGGGVGLSCHGRYRVFTERIILSMPENIIGFVPDVGFALLAAKGPGKGAVGGYMGLTGKRISTPADMLFMGLGTHYVPSESLASLKDALLTVSFSDDPDRDVKQILDRFNKDIDSESELESLFPLITSTFGADMSVVEIMDKLRTHKESTDKKLAKWADEALVSMQKGAPFTLCLTQYYLGKVASAYAQNDVELTTVRGVMKMEYRMAMRISLRSDFAEGVRAVLVDKDQNPKWDPPSFEEVDFGEIEGTLKPLDRHIQELLA